MKSDTELDPKLKNEIFKKIETFMDSMSIDEIVSCFMCLHQIEDSDLRGETMNKLMGKVFDELKKDEDFNPVNLARFTFPFSHQKELYLVIIAIDIIPHIIKQLEKCSNVDDLNYITIAMNNLHHLITYDNLNKFKMKVREFLDEELLNITTLSCILRIVNFLNYPHWSTRNFELVRDLCLEIEEKIPTFNTRHLMTLNKTFQIHMESSRMLRPLVKRSQELMEDEPSVELLSMAVLCVNPDQRMSIANMIEKIITNYRISSTSSNETLQMVFKILRLLKMDDLNLCDSFWFKALNEIYNTKVQHIHYKLAQYIQKYMFFNNNLGGTYRHIEFETCMVEMLKTEMKQRISPKEFAMFASFIIAYGDDRVIPKFIVDNIENYHEQFSSRDCWHLSRGIQILQEIRLRQFISKDLELQIKSMNYSLEKSSQRHLEAQNVDLPELNRIIRSHIYRKAPRESRFFHEMMKLYDKPLNLDSRAIREISFNMTASNFRMDSVCDQFVDYVLKNWDHVTGDTLEKILTTCYTFSYFPDNEEFLRISSEIIMRDFNYMNGISIVQGLLALIFYKSCPQTLITKVFSQDFIKRLEQEIEMCYSKNTYPQRIMHQFMKLNRAVCLDCPEINVKWFQQSFVEAQITKATRVEGKVQKEVNRLLLEIVKSPDFLNVNHVTPYGYQIDFELYTDTYNRFVKIPPEKFYQRVPEFNKVAILILSSRVFCDNDINRLKGAELLRMRHLEMLGYRVVHIKSSDFGLMYRNVKDKIGYMKSLLRLGSS